MHCLSSFDARRTSGPGVGHRLGERFIWLRGGALARTTGASLLGTSLAVVTDHALAIDARLQRPRAHARRQHHRHRQQHLGCPDRQCAARHEERRRDAGCHEPAEYGTQSRRGAASLHARQLSAAIEDSNRSRGSQFKRHSDGHDDALDGRLRRWRHLQQDLGTHRHAGRPGYGISRRLRHRDNHPVRHGRIPCRSSRKSAQRHDRAGQRE